MAESNCRKCRNWRECAHDPAWFHFGEIRFCIPQIFWVIQSGDILRAGDWVSDPSRSGDSTGQRRVKTEGTFVKAILIIAELDERLKRTGIYGKLLVSQVEAGRTLETLDWEAEQALRYISGFTRKTMSFYAWKKQQIYRKMTTNQ